jgi:cupin 2 domain-containing protein
MREKNIFSGIRQRHRKEMFKDILSTRSFRIERILSSGQATRAGAWLVQQKHEWVMLLSGSAGLSFEGRSKATVLGPGDHVLIPAGTRHRVEWTAPGKTTVWLAVHYSRSLPVRKNGHGKRRTVRLPGGQREPATRGTHDRGRYL